MSSALCRIYLVINTTDSFAVHAEAWLPDAWEGRFLATGNGGTGGCESFHCLLSQEFSIYILFKGIDYLNMDYATSMHFATIGGDNGHDGMSGKTFLKN